MYSSFVSGRDAKLRQHNRQTVLFSSPTKKSIQMLSAAETYLERKFLISEMCIVSLMVVSLLRTWRRPLSSVFSLITTVKSTPISSYLQFIDTETHQSTAWETLLMCAQWAILLPNTKTYHRIVLYFSFIDVCAVSRYPGQAEILDSMNSCSSPSQTYKIFIYSLIYCD